MRVLAIDPGSLAFGYVVSDSDERLECYGSGDLSRKPYDQRFTHLIKMLDWIWERFEIDEIAIERPVRFKGNKIAALEVAYQSIVVWARTRVKKNRIFSYHPATWRVGVAGSSRASKEYVGHVVCLHFQQFGNGVPDHVTDAAGILLHHFAQVRVRSMIEGGI